MAFELLDNDGDRCVTMVQIYELCFLVRRLAQVVDRNRESYLASALFDDELRAALQYRPSDHEASVMGSLFPFVNDIFWAVPEIPLYATEVPKLLSVSVKPRPDAVSEHAMDWLQDAKKLRAGWQKDRQSHVSKLLAGEMPGSDSDEEPLSVGPPPVGKGLTRSEYRARRSRKHAAPLKPLNQSLPPPEPEPKARAGPVES